jgi:hypothetical protein
VSATFLPAESAIGQPDLVSGDPALIVGPNTLDGPNGHVASGSLSIPDSSNHRILGFNQIPTASNANADFVMGQDGFDTANRGLGPSSFNFPADLVVGQPDFTTQTQGGGAAGLNQPRGIFADGQSLYVADRGNNRVLFFDLP